MKRKFHPNSKLLLVCQEGIPQMGKSSGIMCPNQLKEPCLLTETMTIKAPLSPLLHPFHF
ncbi:hypothetical protein KSP40_PGU014827 [Platanthera guangdongensis]|uniref:Uncharacterized protein n=1 Tax=Platanthera guangdongensis TaxID=2320717 RepID=A0ABR2N0S8_9ASPA